MSSALRRDVTVSSQTAEAHGILDRLAQLRILPVATLPADTAEDVGRALVDAGLPCIEITLRAAGAAEAISRARKIDGLLVGAGTVLTTQQAREAAQAGAAFALAPGLNEEIVDCCRELGLPFFPGVATPTEIDRARRLGLRTLKAFPITTLGGPAFLRAVFATFPDVRFIPTGGVTASNLAGYLELPNVLACGGTWLISQQILQTRAFDELSRLARETLKAMG